MAKPKKAPATVPVITENTEPNPNPNPAPVATTETGEKIEDPDSNTIPASDREVQVNDNAPPATAYESEFANQGEAEAALKEVYKDAEKHAKAAGSYMERLARRCADVAVFMSRSSGKIPVLNDLKAKVRELTTGEVKKMGPPTKEEREKKKKTVLTIVDKTESHKAIGVQTFENMLPLCCKAAILILRGDETTFCKAKRSPTTGDVLSPDKDGAFPSNAYDGIAYDQHILYPKVQTGVDALADGTKVPSYTDRSAIGQFKNKRLVGVTASVILEQYKRFVDGAEVDPNTGIVQSTKRGARAEGNKDGGAGEAPPSTTDMSHEDILRAALKVVDEMTKGKTKALWDIAADLFRELSAKFEDEGYKSEDDQEEDAAEPKAAAG